MSRKVRYVSIDIETLGLNIQKCDVIEFGAVIETMEVSDGGVLFVDPLDQLPTFQCYFTKDDDLYVGEPYAMWMNQEILKRIADRRTGYTYMPIDMLDECFADWLHEHDMVLEDRVVIAGKNVQGFDLPFLCRHGFGRKFRMDHKVIDPGTLFFDPKLDNVPPSLGTCLSRSGFGPTVKHAAVEDSLDVIRCMRYKLLNNHANYQKTESA